MTDSNGGAPARLDSVAVRVPVIAILPRIAARAAIEAVRPGQPLGWFAVTRVDSLASGG